MAQMGVVEGLRAQLHAVDARHRADAAGAARAFWEVLADDSWRPRPDERQGRPGAGGSRGAASERVRSGRSGSGRAGSGRAGSGRDGSHRRRFRPGGAWTADGRQPRGRGVWSEVPIGSPVPVVPRDARWASEDELADRVSSDPGWFDAAREPGPELGATVGIRIEALIGTSLHRYQGEDVLRAAEQVAALRAQHDVMLVNLVAELESRGEDSPGGLSRTDWLRSLDPGMTAGQARAFARVGEAVTDPRWRELAARVTLQHLSVPQAAALVDFHTRCAPVADPDELDGAIDDLLEQAPRLTIEQFHRLVRHHTEQVRPPRDEDRLDAGRQAARGLWFGQPSATGMVPLRAVLDPEAAAIVKSAVDPLSMPCPEKDAHGHTVAADPRTPATRRADALMDVIQRGVAAADKVPTTDKARVVVTIDFDTLLGDVKGSGLAMSGDVLSPATVRRMACDAAIIPMVLGTRGELLDVGRDERLVTRKLRLALWHRDGGCSFPGCTIPAAWTDAHHVTHWVHGGPTSLLNTALLCRRHHTYVHRHDLTATVTATTVDWHR